MDLQYKIIGVSILVILVIMLMSNKKEKKEHFIADPIDRYVFQRRGYLNTELDTTSGSSKVLTSRDIYPSENDLSKFSKLLVDKTVVLNKVNNLDEELPLGRTTKFGFQYTLSFLLKINKINEKQSQILRIYYTNQGKEAIFMSLGIEPKNTRLNISISTTEGEEYTKIGLHSGQIPLNRWLHVTIMVKDKIAKYYLNGKHIISQNITGNILKPDKGVAKILLSDTQYVSVNEIAKVRWFSLNLPESYLKQMYRKETPGNSKKYLECIKEYENKGYTDAEAAHKCNDFAFQLQRRDNKGPNLQLANGWDLSKEEQYRYRRPSYKIKDNMIILSGNLKGGNGGMSSALGYLPIRLRPEKKLVFNTNIGNSNLRIDVQPDGHINIIDSNKRNIKDISLDGIRFPKINGQLFDFIVPKKIQYVRITLPGSSKILNLAGVDILNGDGQNISSSGQPYQSSTRTQKRSITLNVLGTDGSIKFYDYLDLVKKGTRKVQYYLKPETYLENNRDYVLTFKSVFKKNRYQDVRENRNISVKNTSSGKKLVLGTKGGSNSFRLISAEMNNDNPTKFYILFCLNTKEGFQSNSWDDSLEGSRECTKPMFVNAQNNNIVLTTTPNTIWDFEKDGSNYSFKTGNKFLSIKDCFSPEIISLNNINSQIDSNNAEKNNNYNRLVKDRLEQPCDINALRDLPNDGNELWCNKAFDGDLGYNIDCSGMKTWEIQIPNPEILIIKQKLSIAIRNRNNVKKNIDNLEHELNNLKSDLINITKKVGDVIKNTSVNIFKGIGGLFDPKLKPKKPIINTSDIKKKFSNVNFKIGSSRKKLEEMNNLVRNLSIKLSRTNKNIAQKHTGMDTSIKGICQKSCFSKNNYCTDAFKKPEPSLPKLESHKTFDINACNKEIYSFLVLSDKNEQKAKIHVHKVPCAGRKQSYLEIDSQHERVRVAIQQDCQPKPNYSKWLDIKGNCTSTNCFSHEKEGDKLYAGNRFIKVGLKVIYGGCRKASCAINGNNSGIYELGNITSTEREDNPNWEIDLREARVLSKIKLHFRSDCCTNDISGAKIECFNNERVLKYQNAITIPSQNVSFSIPTTEESYWSKYGSGYRDASYSLENGLVTLSGLAKKKSSSNKYPSLIEILEPELRPDSELIFAQQGNKTNTMIHIKKNGEVIANSNYNGNWISLDGISYTIKTGTTLSLKDGWKNYSNNSGNIYDRSLLKVTKFIGADGGVDLGNPDDLRLTGNFTMAFWIRPVAGGIQAIFTKSDSQEGSLYLKGNSLSYLYGNRHDLDTPELEKNFTEINFSYKLDTGVFTHVTIIRNLSSKNLELFINGSSVEKVVLKFAQKLTESYKDAYLGKIGMEHPWAGNGNGQIINFRGELRNVFLSKQIISKSEISHLAEKISDMNIQTRPFSYNINNGTICLSGVIRPNSQNIADIITVLPYNLSPNRRLTFNVSSNFGGQSIRIDILPNGYMTIVSGRLNNVEWITLDNIKYDTYKLIAKNNPKYNKIESCNKIGDSWEDGKENGKNVCANTRTGEKCYINHSDAVGHLQPCNNYFQY